MKRNLKSEFGHGMVEIIGVLAIMGILSIVFVFAYKRAMDKTTTNEVLAALSRRAVIAASQKEMGATINLEEFDDEAFTAQYHVTYQDEDEDFFSITMENVPDEIVQGLIRMKWKMPYNIYVNGIQINDYDASKKSEKTSFASFLIKPAYAEGQGNQVKIIFHKKLEAYDKQAYMDKGTCTGSGGRWDGDRCFCDGKVMTESGCKVCDKYYMENGVAKCGQKGENEGDEKDEDVACYRDSECRGCLEVCDNGKCVLNEDDECDGNHLYCDGTKIMACIKTGSKDTACATQQNVVQDCAIQGSTRTCSMESGHAECVDVEKDCPAGEFKDKDGNCVPCSDIVQVSAEETECDTCSNVDIQKDDHGNRICVPKCASNEFHIGPKCYPCSDIKQEGESATSVDADHTDCASCSNVDVITNGQGNNVCAPKCGSEEFRIEGQAMCHPCSEIRREGGLVQSMTAKKSDCKKCSNVDIIKQYDEEVCVPKCASNEFRINNDCVPCSYIRKENGHTYSADATISDCASKCSGVDVVVMYGQKVCTPKCENGEERNADGECVKVGCATGEFKDKDGNCVSCDVVASSGYLKGDSECDTCPGVKVKDGVCVVKCPSGTYGGKDGYPFITADPYCSSPSSPSCFRARCSDCSDIQSGEYNQAVGTGSTNCATACPDVEVVRIGNAEVCSAKCPSGYERHQSGFCVKEQCDSREFRDESSGACRKCDEIAYNRYAVDTTDCESCPNIEIMTVGAERVCVPKCASNEFRYGSGDCFPCSYIQKDQPYEADISDCEKCPGIDVITQYGYKLCVPKCDTGYTRNDYGECVKVGCATGEFKDANGNCISCSTITSGASASQNNHPSATKTECAKCPKIRVSSGKCLAPCPAGTIGGSDGYPKLDGTRYTCIKATSK